LPAQAVARTALPGARKKLSVSAVAREERQTPVAREELQTPVAREELQTPVAVAEGATQTTLAVGKEATQTGAETPVGKRGETLAGEVLQTGAETPAGKRAETPVALAIAPVEKELSEHTREPAHTGQDPVHMEHKKLALALHMWGSAVDVAVDALPCSFVAVPLAYSMPEHYQNTLHSEEHSQKIQDSRNTQHSQHPGNTQKTQKTQHPPLHILLLRVFLEDCEKNNRSGFSQSRRRCKSPT